MDRVLVDTPATISNSWYSDGTIADPGTTTLGITTADGTVLVAAGTATTGTGAAARTFSLTTTHTADLDILTVTWTTTNFGVATTYVEIVGDFLFSLSDLDALLQTPSDYTAAKKTTARTWAEQRIEGAIGRAFVPRYAYEYADGVLGGIVSARHQPVRTIRSVDTRDGTTWTAQTATDYEATYGGFTGTWTTGYRNARIGYEYGEDYPPGDVSEAAALWAKVRLVQGPVDDRELQRFIGDTGAVVNLATPGRNSWSGIPDVDAVIEAHLIPAIA